MRFRIYVDALYLGRKSASTYILQQEDQCVTSDSGQNVFHRPLDEDRKFACYSGKKTHSIKNNLLCTKNFRIVWLSSTYEGNVHDKKICDEEPLLLPKGIRLWQDTGFIGHRPDGVEICMPKKKPKGKELTTVEKQENKRISGIRIKVEHAIGGMKKCRIVKERFRCHKFGFEDMVILIAFGLHNFRISHKMSYITI
ncbi:MAG: transposase family protein [Parabacteroides sp.]|nr:transposase family protein [Parabacteroides sp.]